MVLKVECERRRERLRVMCVVNKENSVLKTLALRFGSGRQEVQKNNNSWKVKRPRRTYDVETKRGEEWQGKELAAHGAEVALAHSKSCSLKSGRDVGRRLQPQLVAGGGVFVFAGVNTSLPISCSK
jgi:hypothetical protein